MADCSLDSKVSDYHIAEIADENCLGTLGPLPCQVELTDGEQQEIAADYHGFYNLQKQKALEILLLSLFLMSILSHDG